MAKIDGGLRALFQERMPFVHWTTIETGGTALGVPDLEGCRAGRQVWVEMKQTEHWAVSKVRPNQVAWIERRLRAGGNVYLGVRRAGGELWLLSGRAARPLILGERLSSLSTDLVLGRWDGGPARWDWGKVAETLGF